MGNNEYYMANKPTVRLHPAVYSAMHAYCNRTGKPDNRDEKGFLLAGDVNPDTLVVDVKNVIIFPQKGNGTAVDFDNDHPVTPKFWPAVHDYLAKTNQKLLGWAHYFSGGVHHSHTDNFTDDVFSFASKEGGGSPLMLSMTWNDEKAGVEGKLWVKAGGHDVQLSFSELPVEYVTLDQSALTERFFEELKTKTKVKLVFDFDGIEYQGEAKDLGTDDATLAAMAIADLRANMPLYLDAKIAGEKLRKRISNASIDQAIVTATHEQLDKLWKPFSYTTFKGGNHGGHGGQQKFQGAGGDGQRQAGESFFPAGSYGHLTVGEHGNDHWRD